METIKPQNNILPFLGIKKIVFLKWKKELEKDFDESKKQENINNLASFEEIWSADNNQTLRNCIKTNGKIPTLEEFIEFINQEMAETFKKNQNNRLNLGKNTSLIFDNFEETLENLTLQEQLKYLFGEIGLENLNPNEFDILLGWKKDYDEQNKLYLLNPDLQKHILNLENFLYRINFKYQEYLTQDNYLAFFLAKLSLKIQSELNFYSSKKL